MSNESWRPKDLYKTALSLVPDIPDDYKRCLGHEMGNDLHVVFLALQVALEEVKTFLPAHTTIQDRLLKAMARTKEIDRKTKALTKIAED